MGLLGFPSLSYFFPEGFFEEALAPVKKGSSNPGMRVSSQLEGTEALQAILTTSQAHYL